MQNNNKTKALYDNVRYLANDTNNNKLKLRDNNRRKGHSQSMETIL